MQVFLDNKPSLAVPRFVLLKESMGIPPSERITASYENNAGFRL